MKKLVAAFIFCFCIISLQSYAASGHGYTEYGETTIKSSPGSGFEELPPETYEKMFHKKKLQKSSPGIAITHTTVPAKQGKTGEFVTVEAFYQTNIVNNTDHQQTYQLSFRILCAYLDNSYSRYVTLEPGGTYKRTDHSYGPVQEFVVTDYDIDAWEHITGEVVTDSHDNSLLVISSL